MSTTLAAPEPTLSYSNPNNQFGPIASDLEAVETLIHETLETSKRGVDGLIQHLAHYRGKRLRPALVLLTAQACSQIKRPHQLLAAVMEMIHTATLVHDDVLDGAMVRRHVMTVNAGWGNQASVLLGDYLFTQAFILATTLGDNSVGQIIGEASNRLCAGELHQICERGNLDLSEKEYFDIIGGKTAALTSCCCRLGAMFNDMAQEDIEHLARYGHFLGLAFQIADDVLDLVGEEQSAGKSLGTDLEQQKLTLPLIRLLSRASAADASMLRNLLTNPGKNKRAKLIPHLQSSGALAYTRRRAEQLADQAVQELACLSPSECKTVLEQLTNRVVHREC